MDRLNLESEYFKKLQSGEVKSFYQRWLEDELIKATLEKCLN